MSLAVDLDGPILDPRPRQTTLLSSLLRREPRLALSIDSFWELKREGRSTEQALTELGVDGGTAQRLARCWTQEIEEPQWLRLDPLVAGAWDALHALASKGVAPTIVTARRNAHRVAKQIEDLGLMPWCDGLHVVSPNSAASEKARVLRQIGSRAYVGDTESDAEAAAAAGTDFAAVSTGQRSDAFLRSLGLETFESLEAAVRKLRFLG